MQTTCDGCGKTTKEIGSALWNVKVGHIPKKLCKNCRKNTKWMYLK